MGCVAQRDSIAHDFNNVVGAILGWAEIAYDQCGPNQEIADRFARIREQGERAASLTRELLAFARRQTLQPRIIDLNSIASGLLTFLDRVIGKDIELKIVTVPPDAIKADPTQIEQVIMNLCINARDAMPTGGRLIVATQTGGGEMDASSPDLVRIDVRDTGAGMSEETIARIFEPFFSTKMEKGTGLGLWVSHGVVQAHGGTLKVRSRPGQGTTFTITLPVAGPQDDAEH